ncbi:hypothetical protein MNV49_005874 [Pseudohyphozyma bogoriensis]|nr:hypothetical protein MNV49_005874 [Pseudohyphozyma bogoriensis]
MPELPEVERAKRRLEKLAVGTTISKVDISEDPIVFSSVAETSFITNFRGTASTAYRVPRAKSEDDGVWPPKYMKMVITFTNSDESVAGEWAFSDPRRLGRIKLVEAEDADAMEPLSLLGADPLLDMPSVEVLAEALEKRHAPIKAVLLDQNGPLCGIGNWMVDEILFQSRLHPAHPSSALSSTEVQTLHDNIRDVVVTATDVDAEASLFPKHWLFSSRWNKGKKDNNFTLPSGEVVPITYITVGGRTSAVIASVQKLPSGYGGKQATKRAATAAKGKRKAKEEDEDEDDEGEEVEGLTSPHFKKPRTAVKEETSPYFNKTTKLEVDDEKLSTTSKTTRASRSSKSRASR